LRLAHGAGDLHAGVPVIGLDVLLAAGAGKFHLLEWLAMVWSRGVGQFGICEMLEKSGEVVNSRGAKNKVRRSSQCHWS
jgi:hypothetical protein